jgi:hypothetical protein
LAFLLGNSLHSLDSQLKAANVFRPKQPLSDAVDTGVDGILRVLGKADNFGGALVRPSSAKAALVGALALYSSDQRKAALELVGMLKSSSVFEKALVNIIERHFGVNGWSLPEN